MKKTVKTIKKMKAGGASFGGCGKGQCPKYVGGERQGCEPCPGVVAGITTALTGAAGVIGKMTADAIKRRKEVTDIKKANPGMKRKDAREKYIKQQDEKLAAAGKKPVQESTTPFKKGGYIKSKPTKKTVLKSKKK